MKTLKHLFLSILILISLYNILYSQMNFPLHAGDKFVYYVWCSSTYPGGGEIFQYYTTCKVLMDSSFNNKKYFIMNYYPNRSEIRPWIRFDSVTKSIYAYDSTNSCQYYFKEKLIDSLAMLSGTANNCSYNLFNGTSNDTLFGLIGTTIYYRTSLFPTYKEYHYNSNFGIIKYYDVLTMGAYSHYFNGTLKGCIINGIKYGDTLTTYIEHSNNNIPNKFSLSQNYPNPYNPTTKIKFDIPSWRGAEGWITTLRVFDMMGREIQTIVNERLQPGTYETTFDGSQLTSGVYFYRMISEGYSETKKMLLLK